MYFEAKDLPYQQFEKIGLGKREVLALPPEDLKALLTGRTTTLQTIKIQGQDIQQVMQAKLSIQRYPDGSLNLMVHPIRREIKNEDNLANQQLEALKKGETVIAPRTSMNGEKDLYLFQLDKETNEIVKTRLNSISVPRYLMDIELTQKQKSDLLQGKTIELVDKYGNIQKVSIDLINQQGFRIHHSGEKTELNRGTERTHIDKTIGLRR